MNIKAVMNIAGTPVIMSGGGAEMNPFCSDQIKTNIFFVGMEKKGYCPHMLQHIIAWYFANFTNLRWQDYEPYPETMCPFSQVARIDNEFDRLYKQLELSNVPHTKILRGEVYDVYGGKVLPFGSKTQCMAIGTPQNVVKGYTGMDIVIIKTNLETHIVCFPRGYCGLQYGFPSGRTLFDCLHTCAVTPSDESNTWYIKHLLWDHRKSCPYDLDI